MDQRILVSRMDGFLGDVSITKASFAIALMHHTMIHTKTIHTRPPNISAVATPEGECKEEQRLILSIHEADDKSLRIESLFILSATLHVPRFIVIKCHERC